MESVLTKSQTFRKTKFYHYDGTDYRIVVDVRYDDKCNNGHNTFAVTSTISRKAASGMYVFDSGGQQHEDVAEHFPELAPYLKWHLTSSDGPMHYIANSLYWAGQTKYPEFNLECFRSTAVWPEATEADMRNPALEQSLKERLPALLEDFRKAIIELGFTY